MKIAVHPGYFSEPQQARDEIGAAGLYPVEMNVPPVRNESHWHEFSTRMYILDGELNITDSALGLTHRAVRGALVEVPRRTLHSEASASGYRIIAAMSVDPASLSGPIDFAPELLQQR